MEPRTAVIGEGPKGIRSPTFTFVNGFRAILTSERLQQARPRARTVRAAATGVTPTAFGRQVEAPAR